MIKKYKELKKIAGRDDSILSNIESNLISFKLERIKEKKIASIIAKKLKKDKIFFAGIDFIDGRLNGDINVTSPTGLKTLFDISKIKSYFRKLF